jgi:hypothetical protein
MSDVNLERAVDDVRLIKKAIDKATDSLSAFSKIFLYWGIAAIINSIITVIMKNPNTRQDFFNLPIMYLLTISIFINAVCIIGFFIWRKKKKIVLNEIGKNIIKIWAGLVFINMIYNLIPITVLFPDGSATTIYKYILSVSSPLAPFIFALGFYFITLFTNHKKFRIPAIIYLIYGIFTLFFENMYDIIDPILYPVTFLIVWALLRKSESGVV